MLQQTLAPTEGGVLSILKAGVVNVALLPALSVTTTCAVRPTPSPVTCTGLPLLVENTPECSS